MYKKLVWIIIKQKNYHPILMNLIYFPSRMYCSWDNIFTIIKILFRIKSIYELNM